MLYLRVRRAATVLGATLVVVHPRRTGLHDVATHTVTYRPGDGPEVLRKLAAGGGDLASARAALGDGPVVVIVGRTSPAEDPRLAEGVAAFATGLAAGGSVEVRILPVERRANVYGALDMGLSPGLLPGRVAVDDEEAAAALEAAWGRAVAGGPGRDATGILEGLSAGELEVLLLHGADPVREHPDPGLVTCRPGVRPVRGRLRPVPLRHLGARRRRPPRGGLRRERRHRDQPGGPGAEGQSVAHRAGPDQVDGRRARRPRRGAGRRAGGVVAGGGGQGDGHRGPGLPGDLVGRPRLGRRPPGDRRPHHPRANSASTMPRSTTASSPAGSASPSTSAGCSTTAVSAPGCRRPLPPWHRSPSLR